MTLQQLTKFLDKYKKDIIAPVHQGDEARKNAYNEAKIVHKCFENFIKKFIIKENFDINSIFSKEITERKEIIYSKYHDFIKNLKESEIKQIIPEEITKKYPLTKYDLYKFGEINKGLLFITFFNIKKFINNNSNLNKINEISMENILNNININPFVSYKYIEDHIKEEKNILKYLCIKIAKKPEETAKTIEENWHDIGRGILHHDFS